MASSIINKTFDGEFRICPECGYEDGFHTMLKQEMAGVRWLFICPACHKVFDIGCKVSVEIDPDN